MLPVYRPLIGRCVELPYRLTKPDSHALPRPASTSHVPTRRPTINHRCARLSHTMPRTSTAALSVVPGLRTVERVKAPKDLTAAQRTIFEAIVGAKPPDWFIATDVPMLVELTRHMARADEVERLLRELPDGDVDGLDKLARMADRETQRIAMLMTRLRLTPQSRYVADSKKLGTSGAGDALGALMDLESYGR